MFWFNFKVHNFKVHNFKVELKIQMLVLCSEIFILINILKCKLNKSMIN